MQHNQKHEITYGRLYAHQTSFSDMLEITLVGIQL
jgi:hypothetical protein